jgi:hypothetical protein
LLAAVCKAIDGSFDLDFFNEKFDPFFQFILKGLKCFNCGAKIPVIYTFIELFAGLFCVLFFLFNPIDGYYIIKFLAILSIFLSVLLFYKEGRFYDKLNWIILSLSLLKLGYDASGQDLLSILVMTKLLNGLIFAMVFSFICKSKIIQEICFFLTLSIFFTSIEFIIVGVISTIILLVLKKNKGIFLIPFLALSLIPVFLNIARFNL